MSANRFIPWLTWIGWLLLGYFAVRTAMLDRIGQNVRAFQAAYLIGFVGYFMLVIVVRSAGGHLSLRRSWPLWLLGCALVRIALLGVEPSDDVYRYLWEGRIQLAGFNPYQHAPDDPALAHLRDAKWERINHPDFAAIYPPVAQGQFLLAALVRPTITFFKLLHVGWDMLVVIVLGECLRQLGRRPHEAIVYALCPLVLSAFAVEGHADSLMLLWMVLCVWAVMNGRLKLAGGLLGLAMATKLVAVVLWPWLLIRHWRAASIALLVIVSSYIPYAGAGTGLFASLVQFGRGETFFSFLGTFGLDSPGGPPIRELAAVCFGLWLFFNARRAPSLTNHAGAAMGGMLLLLPVVHYWYLTWVLLFLPFVMRWRWLAAAGVMLVYFEANLALEETGTWFMPPWAPWILWIPFAAVWLVEAAIQTAERSVPRRSSNAQSSRSGF